jgi:tRNA (cmo5U34)-methyltransferase
MIKKNNIFKVDTKIKLKNKSWSFDSSLANEFDNHINKSVPLYKDLHWLCLQVSDYFIRKDSTVYDLGCSTGKLLKRLSIRHLHKKKIKFIGLDIINKMIQHAKKNNKRKNINFLKRDLIKTKLKKNDFIISFFTIQFIEQKNRQKLINKIFKSLNWGGAFFFAEKIRSSGARNQEMTNEIYKNWKLDQGFSLSEVNFKTESLKGVLDPFTHSGNVAMLKRAGFDEINVISKYLNFEIYLAIK